LKFISSGLSIGEIGDIPILFYQYYTSFTCVSEGESAVYQYSQKDIKAYPVGFIDILYKVIETL